MTKLSKLEMLLAVFFLSLIGLAPSMVSGAYSSHSESTIEHGQDINGVKKASRVTKEKNCHSKKNGKVVCVETEKTESTNNQQATTRHRRP